MENIDIGGQHMRNVLLWSGDIFCNIELIPATNVVLCNALYVLFFVILVSFPFSYVAKWKTLHIFPKITFFAVFCGNWIQQTNFRRRMSRSKQKSTNTNFHNYDWLIWLIYCVLTPLSAIFLLYHGDQF
jgi:hypothetical protein